MSSGGARFHATFDRLRRADGEATAVVDAATGATVSRDGLARLVDLAGSAIAVGAPSDRGDAGVVALRIPTSPELIAAVLACWRDARVPLLIDADLPAAEAAAIARSLGLAQVLSGTALAREGGAEPARPAEPLAPDTAVLKLTSGTTGEPCAVAVTGAALAAGVAQIVSTMGIRPEDRNLVPVPLSHSYGFDSAVVMLAEVGCPAVLGRGLAPGPLCAVARASRATVLLGVPVLLDVLSRSAAAAGGGWPELRLVVSAGAPLGVETRERFAECFGVRPRNFYGATECGGITFDREGTDDVPESCVGSALDGVAIELVDADDGVGRVRVRTASAASAYLPSLASGAAGGVIDVGSFLTADLGRLDEGGRLHLLGRVDDAVNVGGRKVFPAEVERVIRAVAGVRDVAVVGVERAAGAGALCAIVVAAPEVDRARVIAACEAKLARHKVPRTVEFRAELPRTSRGKLDRRRLQPARS
jgi:acyl-CoA synthetase (AMP-forming)/AMP-acid ligase II